MVTRADLNFTLKASFMQRAGVVPKDSAGDHVLCLLTNILCWGGKEGGAGQIGGGLRRDQ